jgi:hypothetical protein
MQTKKVLILLSFLATIFLIRSVSAQPIISSVVQVSPDNLFDPEEVSIAIDQVDPTHIAAGSGPNYFYYSNNHGQSWQGDGIGSSFGQAGDASLTCDSKGNIYHAHLSSPVAPGYWLDRIVIQKSTDGGTSFPNDGSFAGHHPTRQQYKEFITCDLSTSSPYHDNLYLVWSEFDVFPDQNTPTRFDSSRILFSKSSDAGLTWSTPITISDRQGDCSDTSNSDVGASCATAPNGDIYITWYGPGGLMFDKSTDGGKTFGKDKVLSIMPLGWNFRETGFATILCDISNSKQRGNLYVVYSYKQNGVKNSDIILLRSTDAGSSWSSPIRVNNDTTEFEQYLPAAAIDQVTGVLYSVFYDGRNTNGGNSTDLYLARSVDGGLNFSNYRLTLNPIFTSSGIYFTDYIGIAAFNSYVYPIWKQLKQSRSAIYLAVVRDTGAFHDAVLKPTGQADQLLSLQISPNPASNRINFDLLHQPENNIIITLSDVMGRNVATIYNSRSQSGDKKFSYDSRHLLNGIYYCTAQIGNERFVQKILILH